MAHDTEIEADAGLVRRLLARQFPEWSGLPLTVPPATGTENTVYRLGDGMAVRLPRFEGAVGQIGFEHEWLPRLAPHLPVAVPETIALGRPGEGYSRPWAITRWVDGDHPTGATVDGYRFATDLGEFVAALRTAGADGLRQGYRAGPLRSRDAYVREWAAKASGVVDTHAVLSAWEHALAQPEWGGPPVWTHGDLIPGNVLIRDRGLHAVIDFGAAGAGDPACDAMAAWTLLDARTRPAFRAAAGYDDATWARARGWALTFVGAIAYYRTSNPGMAELGRRAVTEALSEPAP